MTRIVPAQMPRSVPARMAFIAEAPGQEEEEVGRPLVGKSGRVFNAALGAAEIDRRDVYVGNIFEEKAAGNNVSLWLRDPHRMEAAVTRLQRDMAAVHPTVIVALGATPLQVLTGHTEISRMRGSPISSPGPIAPGVKVIPAFHPAYILRQWKMLPVLVGDFVRAASEAQFPEIRYPFMEFTLEPTLGEFERWVRGPVLVDSTGNEFPGLLHTDLVSVDIETGWGQITCIAFAPDKHHAICVPFVDLRKPSRSYWGAEVEELVAWGLVKEVLESPVPILGQNFTYDAYWLLDQMGIRSMRYEEDTRLMHHALFPELPKSLEFMAASYTDKQWKFWGRKGDKREA